MQSRLDDLCKGTWKPDWISDVVAPDGNYDEAVKEKTKVLIAKNLYDGTVEWPP